MIMMHTNNSTFFPSRCFNLLFKLLLFFFFITPWAQAEDITLAWDASDSQAVTYCVYQRTSDSSYDYNTCAYEGTETTCNIKNLAPDTQYFFVVRACLGDDQSGDSNEVSHHTSPDNSQTTPDTSQTTPDTSQTTPDTSQTTPDTSQPTNPPTQNNNETNSDTPSNNGANAGSEIWIDAEDGDLSGTMVIAKDAKASGGQYIWTTKGGDGAAEYSFRIDNPGEYAIWGLVSAATKSRNSFFISVDDRPDEIWDLPISSPWIWDQYWARGASEPTTVYFSAGTHTLRISRRETRAKIDQIIITDNLVAPPEDFQPSDAATFNLVTTTEGSGSVLLSPAGGTYDDGTSVRVTAVPNSGWQFDGWSGDASGSGSPLTIVMNRNMSLRANFSRSPVGTDTSITSSGGEISMEAEEGILSGSMTIISHRKASGGQYASSTKPGDGFAEYTFTVEAPGNYGIWGLVSAESKSTNSFFVSWDDGSDEIWDLPISAAWNWDRYNVRGGADPTLKYLTAGTHTLRISRREARAKIDRIVITTKMKAAPK